MIMAKYKVLIIIFHIVLTLPFVIACVPFSLLLNN